jgi:hypothetical protein
VAYICKGEGVVPAPVSPLVRAPFDRQRDTLKLARMGNADCKRLWNSFAEEAPGLARLVVADVENERRGDAAATEKVDKRLRQAEKLVTKSRKPKKVKAVRAEVSKAHQRLSGAGGYEAELAAVLAITDTWQREQAYDALVSRYGQG